MAGDDDEAQVDPGGVEERAREPEVDAKAQGDAEAQKIPDSDSELQPHLAAWQALISVQHLGASHDFARPGALAK